MGEHIPLVFCPADTSCTPFCSLDLSGIVAAFQCSRRPSGNAPCVSLSRYTACIETVQDSPGSILPAANASCFISPRDFPAVDTVIAGKLNGASDPSGIFSSGIFSSGYLPAVFSIENIQGFAGKAAYITHPGYGACIAAAVQTG